MKMIKWNTALIGFVLLTAPIVHAEVERVLSATISNPAAFAASFGSYVTSGESEALSVTLLQHVIDGANPATHTVVAMYEDMDALGRTLNKQASSPRFAQFGLALSSLISNTSESLAIHRKTWGKTAWEEGDYLAAVLVSSPDEGGWLAGISTMESKSNIKRPGMLRIVRLRGQAGVTHAVLISSPSYAALVEYMEAVEASKEFAKMGEGSSSRTVTVVIYKVANVWK